jgi:hypothetical protein
MDDRLIATTEARMSGLIMDASEIIATLKGATDIAKVVIGASGTLDKVDLKLRLADLMGELATARTQAADLEDTIRCLSEDLAEARKKLNFAGTMQYEAPYYFNVASGQRDGPYCPTCWEGHVKLAIHLYEWSRGSWVCNACGKAVADANDIDEIQIRGG